MKEVISFLCPHCDKVLSKGSVMVKQKIPGKKDVYSPTYLKQMADRCKQEADCCPKYTGQLIPRLFDSDKEAKDFLEGSSLPKQSIEVLTLS